MNRNTNAFRKLRRKQGDRHAEAKARGYKKIDRFIAKGLK